jgi:predicted N-acyltransferase
LTHLKIHENIADIPASQWNALAGSCPFLKHAFFLALQESGCATATTGWQAQFLTLSEGDTLVGGMPLYLKSHSWGEFVFDWAWADAYQRQGMKYYPKLLNAVPFTPASGPRILAASPDLRASLLRTALRLAEEMGVSSLHCLFPFEDEARVMEGEGMMLRQGVQFHWRNPGYADFEDYLADMSHDKRKRIRQERRKVREAGIRFEQLSGAQLLDEHWEFFMRCYENTHLQFNSPMALNLNFFRRVSASMAENILLVIALKDDKPIAGSLCFYSDEALYGRSWGALEYHPALHFEACYYQAIEFCIARRIPLFEGGAQGEHKLSRGFLPTVTWSAHWLAHPGFYRVVDEYLRRESKGMARYVDDLNERSPFKEEIDV